MIDWVNIKPALVAWARKVSGISQVIWKNEPAVFKKPVYVVLEVRSVTGYDQDDNGVEEVTLESGEVVLREYVAGQRTFTLAFSIVSVSQKPAGWSENPLDLSRVRSQLNSCSTLLDAVNVALAMFPDHTVEDRQVDDRWFSVWTSLLQFNTAFRYLEPVAEAEENALSWIETVEGEGDLLPDVEGFPWFAGDGEWTVSTTDETPTLLVPLLSVPVKPKRVLLEVRAVASSGAIAIWEQEVLLDPSGLSVTTLKKYATPSTPATLWTITPSLVAGPCFKVEATGGEDQTVTWVARVRNL